MRRIVLLLGIVIIAGCASPTYSEIDRPSVGNLDPNNTQIIDYIDKRLEEEYYWLDEVLERGGSFNRRQNWDSYLTSSLQRLKTNGDDGYTNAKGQRVLYSYIRDVSTTRAGVAPEATTGFGIDLFYTVLSLGDNRYCFVVNNVYDNSPAAEAGIMRGDLIHTINGANITGSNYVQLFNTIQLNGTSELRLSLERQTIQSANEASFSATISRGTYYASPVAYYDVITIPGSDKRMGYLVYNAFDADYDQELLDALAALAAEGVDSFILDLRTNGGGNVQSAVKLCSALVGTKYAGSTLCELRRNPRNKSSLGNSICALEDVGFSLDIEALTVICSDYTASASELVITGLRGLDIPVTLIGITTEGKNCGMDVTRRTFGSTTVEYAPITFMCYNAKGFGEWGEGITPDIDISVENAIGATDEYFPTPRSTWGDMAHDAGLVAAVASITGKSVGKGSVALTRGGATPVPALTIERHYEGIYHNIDDTEAGIE